MPKDLNEDENSSEGESPQRKTIITTINNKKVGMLEPPESKNKRNGSSRSRKQSMQIDIECSATESYRPSMRKCKDRKLIKKQPKFRESIAQKSIFDQRNLEVILNRNLRLHIKKQDQAVQTENISMISVGKADYSLENWLQKKIDKDFHLKTERNLEDTTDYT